MASSPCRKYYYTYDQCLNIFAQDYDNVVQEKLESPMPWVGLYIAAASAACAVAMAADAFNGFRSKKLWFPSKYFSLNSFTLTVLAVSMKLSVDLTSRMLGVNDRLARVSSVVLMSTAIANFMPSLGSMENNEIMLNLAALSVFGITVAGNVSIRLFQMRYYHAAQLIMAEKIGSIVSMLVLLAILCSSAVMIPTAKKYIESRYDQMHKRISSNEQVSRVGRFSTTDELRVVVRRYWVMAESGGPQFVVARSVSCVTSGLVCLFMALTLLEAHIRLPLMYKDAQRISSNYEWSMDWILVAQSIGVALGIIAPLLRWFAAAQLKSTEIGQKSFKDEFVVEAYWTQNLKHWRDSPLSLRTRHHKFRKVVHDAKRLVLNFFIGVQILIVRASKVVLLVSAFFVKWLSVCFGYFKNLRATDSRESGDSDIDLSAYVLLLEGEPELPKRTLRNIRSEVDKLIRMGKKKQSAKNLIKLLRKSVNFNGVREFDSNEIESLSPDQLEPPNCWSLPVVTLTSIAISVPNVAYQKTDELLSAVSEGLYFAKLIEKTLDVNGGLASIINAADVVWLGVELYKKWLDTDLRTAGLKLKDRTHEETLHKLSDIAEKTVTSFTTNRNNFLVQDPLNWPAKVIAANSMYRITQTIILSGAQDDDHPQTDEEVFERLSVMISDILAACLTNLARVIMLKCHSNAIKEREKNIREAAILLGESEEILETLGQRELPTMEPDKESSIEGWRANMEMDNENRVPSTSPSFQETYGGHDSVELER